MAADALIPVPAGGRIAIAGDWHGNTAWAVRVIEGAARELAPEGLRLVLHLGDFGIWPGEGGRRYLQALEQALLDYGMRLIFVDGNHEDHPQLMAAQEKAGTSGIPVPLEGGGPGAFFDPRIFWLPRGCRWEWYGRTWVAIGGGVSLDRADRTEGRDWWPQEELTPAQERDVIAAGRADVIVAHDVPSGVLHSFPAPPSFWDLRDLARNDRHRERLQDIAAAIRPSWWIHGHLHRSYERLCQFDWGPLMVTGLDRDGGADESANWGVLDVHAMEWVQPHPCGDLGCGKLLSPPAVLLRG